jgi:hypothetical protein
VVVDIQEEEQEEEVLIQLEVLAVVVPTVLPH